MRTKERHEGRENPARAEVHEHELTEADRSPALPARGSQLDTQTLLVLQKAAGNVAVSRFIEGTRAREGAGPTPKRARRRRTSFGRVLDLAERMRRPGGVAGGTSSAKVVKPLGPQAASGGKQPFAKAFGSVKPPAPKGLGAAKGGPGGAAKGMGGKTGAAGGKAAAGPQGFLQIVLGWARKMLGLGEKEAQQALGEKEDEGPGAGKKPGAGGPGEAKGQRAGGAASGTGAGAPGARAREDGDGAGRPAGAGTNGAAPQGESAAADGADATERPRTPEEDPRFQAFKGQLKVTSARTKAHAPAAAKAAEAQGAAVGPANEVESQAKGAQVEEMATQKPGTFDKKAFMDAVKKAIEAASPKNLSEATEFSKSGKAGEVKDKVAGMVTQNKETAEQGIKEKTEAEPDPSRGTPKDVTPMSDEEAGPKPGPVGAASAMPPEATADEVDLSKGPKDVERELAENDVTEDQLRESNEPEMLAAVDAKKEAEKHSADAPGAFRAQEAEVLSGAKGAAQETAETGLGGMHESRAGALAQIAGAKGKTKSADETKRAKVAAELEGIYGKTKAQVTGILDGIEPKVTTTFETGETAARQAFESYVDVEVSAYKKRRYSGWRGKLRWFRDKFKGLPGDVNKIYEQGKSRYLAAMDRVISSVADIVEKDLGAARARIVQGQAETAKYVAGLPKDLKKLGREAAEDMNEKFAALENDVDSKQEELVSTIAEKYVEARDAVDKRIEEMKEANKGLIDKAIGFVKGVIDTLSKLKDLLMNVLRKAISVIGDILRHPIRFIENFMSGVADGLKLFRDKIGDYLEQALIGWLFGPSVLGGQKIEKPESLDFKGIVSIVLQVLGLTKDAILGTLRKKVGAPALEKLKQGVEWVTLLVTEGPAGLWKFIQEKASDLYDTVVGGIMDFVKNKIIRAGIMWLISLLNPAGALVKIVKAIVDVVTFIFERAEQIADFINAVLDAVIDVAKGNVAGVAQKIADALGKGLSLAIGFLASLLGITGIGQTVRGLIDKVRAPIKRVVGGLVDGAVKHAKRLFGKPAAFLKAKYEKSKAAVKAKAAAVKERAKKVATAVGVKLGVIKVEKQFTMGDGDHTLTGKTTEGGDFTITMASTPRPLIARLKEAIKAAKGKPRVTQQLQDVLDGAEAEEARVRLEFGSARPRFQNIGARQAAKDGELRKVKVRVEQMIDIALAKLVKPLSRIKTLLGAAAAKAPAKRWLPSGYKVRSLLYNRGSGWGSVQKQMKQEETEKAWVQNIGAVERLPKAKRNARVTWYIEHGMLPDTAMNVRLTPQWITSQIKSAVYDVDHDAPLARHWSKQGGNNAADENRWQHAANKKKLRVRTEAYNLKWGSKYEEEDEVAHFSKAFWVGRKFRSIFAEGGIENARTIDGKPFLKSQDGDPITEDKP